MRKESNLGLFGKLRLGALGLAVGVTIVVGGWPGAARVLAAGDANEPQCSEATASSPGFRAWLPDCRAYEIVSESNSGDTLNVVGSYGFLGGMHVYYNSFLPTPGEGPRNGEHERFLATRTPTGWAQEALSPPQGIGPSQISAGAKTNGEGVSFAGGFSNAFLMSPYRNPFEEPQVNETTGVGVYRLSISSGAVSMQSLPDSGKLTQQMIETPAYLALAEANGLGEFLAGDSTNGSRAFFVTTAKLATAPGTPQDTHAASNEVYERAGGHTSLVGVLPDGEVPVCGAEVGQGVPSTVTPQGLYSYGAIAPSGENVVFETPGPLASFAGVPCTESETGLFLRNVADSTTVRLPGAFYGGRAGGGAGEEEVIFTLGESEIYAYHVGSGQVVEVGEGDLLTYSTDGSRVYFLGPEGGIFVWRDGTVKRVPDTEAGGYQPGGSGLRGGGLIAGSRPTNYGETENMPVASGGNSDGSHLLFIDTAKLTGYENKGHLEAYVYDAETEAVTCISCNPRNEAPPIELSRGDAQFITSFMLDVGELPYQSPSPPFISDDGSRAVFETTEALVPQDVNGTADVYEWERAETNGCTMEVASYSPVIDGCVYLLSSGLGKEVLNNEGIIDGTHLVGASENLNDVYIQTSESLLPGLDNASKLYDVRVDGGFPYVLAGHGCEAGRCKTASGESAMQGEFTSEAFTGVGNVGPASTHGSLAKESVRRRRLARALKSCRKRRGGRKRVACERAARRRFGTKASRSVHGDEGGAK